MAGFGGFGQQQIGQNMGQRPVRRFGGGQPAPGAMPGYGRTGGAPVAGGFPGQGGGVAGGFPGQGGGVAGGFPGQGGGVADGFPGQGGGSQRVAPISLPPEGPPNPMPAFRNVDPATAGPGMTPPVAAPPRPVVATSPPVAPVGTGGVAPVQPGIAPQGTGEMVAPANPAPIVKPAAPTLPLARPGMMNQPINYAAGLGGFQR